MIQIAGAEKFLAKGCFSKVKLKPLQRVTPFFFQIKDTSFAVGKRSTKTTFSLKDRGISSVAHIETSFFQHEQSDARTDNRTSISHTFI